MFFLAATLVGWIGDFVYWKVVDLYQWWQLSFECEWNVLPLSLRLEINYDHFSRYTDKISIQELIERNALWLLAHLRLKIVNITNKKNQK